MNELLKAYFTDLSESFGRGWNNFWYKPSSILTACVLRIFVGLAALYYIGSFTSDLVRWFGKDGLLTLNAVQQLNGDAPDLSKFFPLYLLNFSENASELWTIHALSLIVVAAFTLGLFTRVTSVLSLCAVLSYVHRAPMLAGQFEPVLTMMMIYLCLAPAGKYLSLDTWLKARRGAAKDVTPTNAEAGVASKPHTYERSWLANLSLRLIQVHLAIFYGVMALTKLGGVFDMPYDAPWWRGQSVWWLIAHSESRLVDLTFMHNAPLLVNAWTYLIVFFELAFALLIWNRLARPLLLVVAIPMWISLALITGLTSFCAIMLIANLAFVSPAVFETACGGRQPQTV